MKKNRIHLIILCSILMLLLCSCNNGKEFTFNNDVKFEKSIAEQYKPSNNKDLLLMFKENAKDSADGSLYVSNNSKIELVSDNVLSRQYQIIGNNNIIYCKSDNSLFLKTLNSEPVEVLKNVDFYSIKYSDFGGVVLTQTYTEEGKDYKKDFYINSEGKAFELYDSKGNASKDYNYINENIKFLSNNKIFYIGNHDILCRYENEKIEKLAANISDFDVIDNGSAYIYRTYDENIFAKWCGANESEFIASDASYTMHMMDDGLSCIYTAYGSDKDDYYSYDLYYASAFSKPVKIAENVQDYMLNFKGNKLYFINSKYDLYSLELPQVEANSKAEDIEKAAKGIETNLISSEVYNLVTNDHTANLVYYNDGNTYALFNGSEEVKLDDSMLTYYLINDSVVYINDSKLYILNNKGESTELASKVNNTSISSDCSSIYYTNEGNELYLYDGKESKLLCSGCNEYNNISIENFCIYEKSLQLADIAGCYMDTEYEYSDTMIKIESDKITYYDEYDGEQVFTVKKVEGSVGYIAVYDDNDILCSIYDEDRLYVDFSKYPYFSGYLDKITNEKYDEVKAENEAEQQAQQQQQQQQQQYSDSLYDIANELYEDGFYEDSQHALFYYDNNSESTGYYTIAGNWYGVYDYTIDSNNYLWVQIKCNVEGTDMYLWICY